MFEGHRFGLGLTIITSVNQPHPVSGCRETKKMTWILKIITIITDYFLVYWAIGIKSYGWFIKM